jgi:copper chaperone CopZ
MQSTFTITGMTCEACEYKVKHIFSQLPGVSDVVASKDLGTAVINADRLISLDQVHKALIGYDKYTASSLQNHIRIETITKTWFDTYKPILLIFAFILVVTLVIQINHQAFDFMQWMRHFMAGFFLVFSFFKFLNLRGFVESYRMYDVVASRWQFWGYLYAFIEFGLGISYLLDVWPMFTNIVTLLVMSVSIIGVLKTVLNKKVIQCACLGSIFELPMSTVTIIEDGLMILMSAFMIISL